MSTNDHDLRRRAGSFTMSSMSIDRQSGQISGLLVSLIATIMVLIGAISFGAWAFLSRQDYKNNSDQKAAAAAAAAKKATEEADAKKYAEEAKNPLKTHKGPEEYGGIAVKHPKTWSGYVIEGGTSGTPVDNYFHPGVVPNITDRNNAYALRIQVVDRTYDAVLKSYESSVNSKKLTASPYALPNVSKEIGARLNGEIERGKQGSLIILPMRNMTLKIWTESPNYMADFNNIILRNLVFSP